MKVLLSAVVTEQVRQVFQVEANLMAQIGSAIETAHRSGVLHREIKPSNILTTAYGRPVLSDFGIASTLGAALVARDLGFCSRVALGFGQLEGGPEVMLVSGVIASPLLRVVAAKQRSRRRRRAAGDPATRIVGGWRELVDEARDCGIDLPSAATRSAVACAIGRPQALVLAISPASLRRYPGATPASTGGLTA